jgi:hypothetical protein
VLALARDRFVDFERHMQIAFDVDVVRWLFGVAVAAAAGVVFGLALVLPGRGRGYRGADAVVLGVVPLLYLIATLVVVEKFANGWRFPSFVDRALFHLSGLFSVEVTMAASALLGIAIGFGLRGREAPVEATYGGQAGWS